MSSLIAALRVSLSANTAQFETGMGRARKDAAHTAKSVNKSLEGIKGIGAGFATALTVGLLTTVVKKALDYAGSLAEVAQQLGVTTRDLQVFRYAAGQLGVSQEQLETGLQKLTITLGKVAAGATAPTKALNAIGLSAKDVAGLDAGAAFRKIADGLAPVTDRAQRAAIEVALFGKSGANLDNLLSGGSKAINQLAKAADALGIVLSDEQIQRADETADKLGQVKTVLQAQIAGVVADNAASIVGLAAALAQLTGAVVQFLGSNPREMLAIIGGLKGSAIGARIAGVPGAAVGGLVGALGGAALGDKVEGIRDGQSTDVKYLAGRLRSENDKLKAIAKTNARGFLFSGIKQPEAAQAAKVKQLTDQLDSALAKSKHPATASAGTQIGQFLAADGVGRRARSARAPREPRDNSARYDEQFEQAQLRNQKEILAAQRDLAVNTAERTRLSLQILQIEHDEETSKIAYANSIGKMTDAQAARLTAQTDDLAALKKQAIVDEAAAQKSADAHMLATTAYDIQRTALQAQSSLATTAAERRTVELKLLELAYAEQKARLEVIAANEKLSDAVRAQARMQLAALPGQKALDQQGVVKSTQGPLASFLDGIPHTIEQTNEAMQNLQVQGINGVADSLVALTGGFDNMRQVALAAIKDILAQLIRLQIMKAIFNIARSAAPQLDGGGAFVGASDPGALSGNFALPTMPSLAFATGGGFDVLGRHGRDRNLLSINGLPIARVSHGERVSVSNDNPGAGGSRGGLVVNAIFNNHAPMTNDQARKTGMQHASMIRNEINKATRNGF